MDTNKINSTSVQAEELSDTLIKSGAMSVTFQDRYDNPVFETLPGEARLWSDTDVIGLFDAETDVVATVAILEQSPLLGIGFHHNIEQIQDKNWESQLMEKFYPMRFGKRLWICPSWHDLPDSGAINVILDPGLAFGTGTHPTTAMCLTWLEGLDLSGKTVIDFGCGSGILAISALKLGAFAAIGIDIDPQAIQASRDNAERNAVSKLLSLYLSQQQPKNLKADVVVANILASTLCELTPQISMMLKQGGDLGFSGILVSQVESIREKYEDTFNLVPVVEEKEEWCQMSGIRN